MVILAIMIYNKPNNYHYDQNSHVAASKHHLVVQPLTSDWEKKSPLSSPFKWQSGQCIAMHLQKENSQ